MGPLVSIVIPCFNAERWIRDAISSALAQTYPRKEVIVIDDGSTDGSLDVIESFGDSIRVKTGPNRGGSAARNLGMKIALGQFIQFLDADDILYPRKLEKQVPLAVNNERRVVYCDFESQETVPNVGYLKRSSVSYADPVILTLREVIGTASPVYSRHLLVEICGWDESLPCAQDYDLNIRLACHGAEFLHLPETLVIVRRVPGSVSANYIRLLDHIGDICWKAYRTLQQNGGLTDKRAEAFAVVQASYARSYLRYKEKVKAMDRFSVAAKMHHTGGLVGAYRPPTRVLRKVLGPICTEEIVQIKRILRRSLSGMLGNDKPSR